MSWAIFLFRGGPEADGGEGAFGGGGEDQQLALLPSDGHHLQLCDLAVVAPGFERACDLRRRVRGCTIGINGLGDAVKGKTVRLRLAIGSV